MLVHSNITFIYYSNQRRNYDDSSQDKLSSQLLQVEVEDTFLGLIVLPMREKGKNVLVDVQAYIMLLWHCLFMPKCLKR